MISKDELPLFKRLPWLTDAMITPFLYVLVNEYCCCNLLVHKLNRRNKNAREAGLNLSLDIPLPVLNLLAQPLHTLVQLRRLSTDYVYGFRDVDGGD